MENISKGSKKSINILFKSYLLYIWYSKFYYNYRRIRGMNHFFDKYPGNKYPGKDGLYPGNIYPGKDGMYPDNIYPGKDGMYPGNIYPGMNLFFDISLF